MAKKIFKHKLEKGKELFCWTPVMATFKSPNRRDLFLAWGYYLWSFWFERIIEESDIAENE